MSEQQLNDLAQRLDAMGDALSRRAIPVPAPVGSAVTRRAAPLRIVTWGSIAAAAAAAIAIGIWFFNQARPAFIPTPGPVAANSAPRNPTIAALNMGARTGDPATMTMPATSSSFARGDTPARRSDLLSPTKLRRLIDPD